MEYNSLIDADTSNFKGTDVSNFEFDDKSMLIAKYKIIETSINELFSDELRRPQRETVNKTLKKLLNIKNPKAIELAESICMSHVQHIIRKMLDGNAEEPILLFEIAKCLQTIMYLKAQ